MSEHDKLEVSCVVSLEHTLRLISTEHGNIHIMPVKLFLEKLWSHKIIN